MYLSLHGLQVGTQCTQLPRCVPIAAGKLNCGVLKSFEKVLNFKTCLFYMFIGKVINTNLKSAETSIL